MQNKKHNFNSNNYCYKCVQVIKSAKDMALNKKKLNDVLSYLLTIELIKYIILKISNTILHNIKIKKSTYSQSNNIITILKLLDLLDINNTALVVI